MTPMRPPHRGENGEPNRMWCGKAAAHPPHTWFAAEHRLTPMRCRGSAGRSLSVGEAWSA